MIWETQVRHGDVYSYACCLNGRAIFSFGRPRVSFGRPLADGRPLFHALGTRSLMSLQAHHLLVADMFNSKRAASPGKQASTSSPRTIWHSTKHSKAGVDTWRYGERQGKFGERQASARPRRGVCFHLSLTHALTHWSKLSGCQRLL